MEAIYIFMKRRQLDIVVICYRLVKTQYKEDMNKFEEKLISYFHNQFCDIIMAQFKQSHVIM